MDFCLNRLSPLPRIPAHPRAPLAPYTLNQPSDPSR